MKKLWRRLVATYWWWQLHYVHYKLFVCFKRQGFDDDVARWKADQVIIDALNKELNN